MATYLILYRPGPAWLSDKPISEQPLMEHGGYMFELFQAGKLLQGGPFADSSGGASVIQVTDLAEAEAIVNADPAIVSGVFTCQLHPWAMVPWDEFGGGKANDA